MIDLPDLIFVGGKKLAGKDFLCDRLVDELCYHKFHIVHPWLQGFCKRHGIPWEEWEVRKKAWREVCQEEAAAERLHEPDVLIHAFLGALPTLPRPLCVTAMRFTNEAVMAHKLGALVVRVEVPDPVRLQRFQKAGERLDLFNDPFEKQVDALPVDAVIRGDLPPDDVVPSLGEAYRRHWMSPKTFRRASHDLPAAEPVQAALPAGARRPGRREGPRETQVRLAAERRPRPDPQ